MPVRPDSKSIKAQQALEKKRAKEAEKQRKKEEKELKAAEKRAEKERQKARKASTTLRSGLTSAATTASSAGGDGDDDDEDGVQWRDEPRTGGGAGVGVYHERKGPTTYVTGAGAAGHSGPTVYKMGNTPAGAAAPHSEPAYEELDLQLTMSRAQAIFRDFPDTPEAAEARAFLLVEASKLEAAARQAKELAAQGYHPRVDRGSQRSKRSTGSNSDGVNAAISALDSDDDDADDADDDASSVALSESAQTMGGIRSLMAILDANARGDTAPDYCDMTSPIREAHTYANDTAAHHRQGAGGDDYAEPRALVESAEADGGGTGSYTTVRMISMHNEPTKGTASAASASASASAAGASSPPPTSPPPPTASELAQFPDMTLEAAQVTMAKGLPNGSVEKRVAQHVLLQEAARLERLMAEMDSDDDGDDGDDDGFVHAATASVPPPPQPLPKGPSMRVKAAPPPAAAAAAASAASASASSPPPTMSVDEATRVMSVGLPDGDPRKVEARRALLHAAAQLEAQMAAIDNEDDGSDDGVGATSLQPAPEAAKATTTSPPPTKPAATRASPQKSAAPRASRSSSAAAASVPPRSNPAADAEKQLEQNAIFKATKLASTVRSDEVQREAEERRKRAQAEARRLIGAQFDADALKAKEQREREERARRLQEAGPVNVPKQVKISRQFSTEDERVQAEASVEDTHARLQEISFDFSFGGGGGGNGGGGGGGGGNGGGATKSPERGSAAKDGAATTEAEPEFEFGWGGSPTASAGGGGGKAGKKAEPASMADKQKEWVEQMKRERSGGGTRAASANAAAMKEPTVKIGAETGANKAQQQNWVRKLKERAAAAQAGVAGGGGPAAASSTAAEAKAAAAPQCSAPAAAAPAPAAPAAAVPSSVDWTKKRENARKYGTEDERYAAEASVEETHARLQELSFDFSFGS